MAEGRKASSGPTVGDVVGGKYRLVRQIGQGGMGTVYEALNLALGRSVALKFLQARVAHDLDLIERFMREARAAAAIAHPRIIDVFDVGWTDDGLIPYFAMELLTGRNLTAELRNTGPMAVDRAVAIMGQVLDALEAAHSNGIVHRDLKPENIFLIRHGMEEDVKVLDFGISKVLGSGASITHTGAVLGTPAYMSPEQARGTRQIDHRTDIYAAGAILFEMIAGRPPYEGETYNEIIIKIATEPPPKISTLRPGLHPAFVAVVDRALSREAEARWPSATAMATALSEVVDELSQVTGLLEEQLEPSFDSTTTSTLQPTPTAWEVTPARETPAKDLLRRRPAAPPDPEERTHELPRMPESPDPYEATVAAPLADSVSLPSGTHPLEAPAPPPPAPPPRASSRIVIGLAVVGLLTGAGTYTIARLLRAPPQSDRPAVDFRPAFPAPARAPDPEPPGPPPSEPDWGGAAPTPLVPPAVAPPATEPPAHARCRIRVTIRTAGATARLDGVPVGPEIDLPSDCGSRHQLQVSAAGYRPRELEVLASDRSLDVELDRIARTRFRKGRPPSTRLEPNPF